LACWAWQYGICPDFLRSVGESLNVYHFGQQIVECKYAAKSVSCTTLLVGDPSALLVDSSFTHVFITKTLNNHRWMIPVSFDKSRHALHIVLIVPNVLIDLSKRSWLDCLDCRLESAIVMVNKAMVGQFYQIREKCSYITIYRDKIIWTMSYHLTS
jgi:hypothetical protein